MDNLEEIRSRLNIEDIVAPYVQLKKSGRSFKACCPFHQEKTPSFVVSPDKGLAYCFGCRKGGDVFAFIQQIENLTFPETVELLAQRAGVTINKQSFSKQHKEEDNRLRTLLEEAQRFFHHNLVSGIAVGADHDLPLRTVVSQQDRPQQTEPLQYLANRGYSLSTVKSLGLGYAPDDFHALESHLISKNFTTKEILEAGLSNQKDVASETTYDRFRARITFPIHDSQGHLVSFGGRTLSNDPNTPKYLNGPETTVYHKGRTLYLFHKAKDTIRKADSAIIVEGYFDALTAHIHGFTNTVASLGTALTPEQLKLIARFTKNVFFAFDADTSGQAASARSIEVAQQLGLNIRIIQIPSGKDPDDAIRSNPAEWSTAVETAQNVMDFYFDRALKTHNIETIEGRKNVALNLLEIIKRIGNAIEQEHYLQKLSTLLKTSVKSLSSEMKKIREIRAGNSFSKHDDREATSPSVKQSVTFRQDYLLGLLLNAPAHIAKTQELLPAKEFPEGEHKALYKELWSAYTQSDPQPDSKRLISAIANEDEQKNEKLKLLALFAESKCASFSEEEIEAEIQITVTYVKEESIRDRIKTKRYQGTGILSHRDLEEMNQLIKEYPQEQRIE